ncbi:MAG: galactose mutarotase [Gammaproteobacteria bacterium]|nr:galactose mutarotase [Gammaproteobacteria bacterium]
MIGNSYELHDDASGIRVHLIDYGATVTNIWCADRDGNIGDVLLGCPTPEDHDRPHPHFNCIVGRYANRITNAQFELDGVLHQLDANIPPHQLHGGRHGFANRLWTGVKDGNSVRFDLISVDGDSGFPGEVAVSATYKLDGSVLRLELSAKTNKPTPISLTAHHYFNLSGLHGSYIGDHEISINADHYLPVSDGLTQLGRIDEVTNTPFDLRRQIPLRERLDDSHPQIQLADGFDHTFALNGTGLRDTAQVYDPSSGRSCTIRTDQPGVQLYTCNTLDAWGKNGVHYGKHQGLCLETQQFPDAPNHANYPDAILRPGEVWIAVTEYDFGFD